MNDALDIAPYVAELNQIRGLLEPLLPACSCRWNGALTSVHYLYVWGEAQWDKTANTCSLRIDRGVLSSEVRWAVFLHEMLHTFSEGNQRQGIYLGARGWEEGIVEPLERLLRPGLIQELGLEFSAAVLAEIHEYEVFNDYSRYVDALDVIAQEAGYDTSARRAFLIDLLSTSLLERSFKTMSLASAALQNLPAVERNRKLTKIAAACLELAGV